MPQINTTTQLFDKYASAYQEKFMDISLYRESLDVFCSLIDKPNANVFEIGCGPGNITKYLLAKRPDFNIEGIDLAPNMIELAKQNNLTANFTVMDGREIGKLTGGFDAIMCGFCMPYLSEAECIKLINDCSALLNSGGIVYFSTMEEGDRTSGYETSGNGLDSTYIYYHREDYLQQALKDNGFELVSLMRKKYPKGDGTQVSDMIFIARKK